MIKKNAAADKLLRSNERLLYTISRQAASRFHIPRTEKIDRLVPLKAVEDANEDDITRLEIVVRPPLLEEVQIHVGMIVSCPLVKRRALAGLHLDFRP